MSIYQKGRRWKKERTSDDDTELKKLWMKQQMSKLVHHDQRAFKKTWTSLVECGIAGKDHRGMTNHELLVWHFTKGKFGIRWKRKRETRLAFPTNRIYRVNARELKKLWAALVDRGANGGIAGKDAGIISKLDQWMDLSGIDNHTVRNLQLVIAGGVVLSDRGEIILVMNQCAHMPDGKTIHSAGQLEWFKTTVNDKSPIVTGEMPSITTLEGFVIPISFRNGLPYIKMRPPTKKELESLPRVPITSDKEWDPSVLDSKVPDDWYKKTPKPSEYLAASIFDVYGNLKDDSIKDKEDFEPEEEDSSSSSSKP